MRQEAKILPLLPLLVILLTMASLSLLAYVHPWSWKALQATQGSIIGFSLAHPFWTPVLFILVYIICALISFPGIFMLSILAGFLFQQPFSTLYVVLASTIGASLLFLAARTAFGEHLYRKAGNRMTSLRKGFLENAASYLLFLRLFPLFPYWIVNFAGAFFNVRFRTFVWTTFIGMIPSVFVYAEAGRGFAVMLDNAEPPHAAAIWNANLIIALIGLSALSLVPLLFSKTKN